jgi:hypothetical protein
MSTAVGLENTKASAYCCRRRGNFVTQGQILSWSAAIHITKNADFSKSVNLTL